ncbi:MAG: right-handed parallel beta-helix repeat-containing protein [Chloroflexaceae bacterium]
MTPTSFKPIVTRGSTPNRLFALTLLLTLLSSTILLHLTGMLSLVQAQTQACDIAGTMSSNRTLGPLAESCDIYNVIGSLVVSEGATLTIEPGTALRFGKNQTLTVHGTLIARGTQHDPILFTAGTTDTWGYIHFSPTSVSAEFDYNDTYTGGSVIQHAVIEKAGGASVQNNGALRAENSVPWVDHVALRNNSTTGLRVFNVFRGNFRYRITNNTIENNRGGGVAIVSSGSSNQAVLRGNTIRDNTGTGVLVSTGIGSSNLVTIIDSNTITGNTLSSSSNAGGGGIHGYCGFDNSFTITNNTISRNSAPNGGGGIHLSTCVGATLTSNTISANNLSSIESLGGGIYLYQSSATLTNNTITNNTSLKNAGGVYLYSSSGTTLTGNDIRNNAARNHGGGLYVEHYSNDLTLNSNTFSGNSVRDGDGGAITIANRARNITITYNTVVGNRAEHGRVAGMYINGGIPTINYNDIYDNTGNGGTYDIYNANGNSAADIDATNNYWATTSTSAIEDRVYHAIDDAALGLVNYTPFSTSAVGTGPTPVPAPTLTATPTRTPSPSPTPTRTPSPSPTPTPPPSGSVPVIQSVSPAEGFNDQITRITVAGSGLATSPAPTVRLSSRGGSFILTDIAPASADKFAATVPANLPAGRYDLIVTNPDGGTGTLPNAFTVLARNLMITQVLPNSGLNDRDNDILVMGLNFAVGATVKLGATDLTTSRVNGTALLAIVPSGLSPGRYDLTVTNPDGEQTQLAEAYTVINEDSNNDLTGSNQALWLNPEAPHAGSPAQIGVFVQRQGGKATLEQVTVEFRRDAVDGILLGRGTVPFLDPRTAVESTTGVEVTFPRAGMFDLYAIIDPDNAVPEGIETNNVVSRTVVIAPPAADRTVPLVQEITINGTAGATVDAPDVTVDITAGDPPPDASGMQSVHMIEYIYNESAQQWIPVVQSGWLPYTQTPEHYRWSLLPLPGMRYLQVRARDNADNISIGNARQLVNYAPAQDRIGRRQTRIYRYHVAAGQNLTVNLEVLNGDADLYVWSSRADQSARVSNLEGSEHEQVIVPAGAVVPGMYQVEVYGYTAAEYRLTTDIRSAPAGLQAELTAGGIAPSKTAPTAPVVPVNSVPDERQGAAPAPETAATRTIYLPLLVR